MKVHLQVPLTYNLMGILKQRNKAEQQLIYEKVFYYRDFYLAMKKRFGAKMAIKYMYGLVDEEIKRTDVKEVATCKKGCNFCCHINVSANVSEAELIKEVYGAFSGEQLEALKEQALCDEETRMFAKHRACVFLKNGECSIYAIRPMACRKHFSVEEPKYCDDLTYHKRNVSLVAYTEIECIVSGIINAEKRGNFAELLLR